MKRTNNFGMNGQVKAYRILEGKQISVANTEDYVTYYYRYDAIRPLFSFDTFDAAMRCWNARVAEGYRNHMLFIADFGVLSPRQQRIVKWSSANGHGENRDIHDKIPYIEIAQYHKGTEVDNLFTGVRYKINKLIIKTRANEKTFEGGEIETKKCFETLDTHRRHGTPFKLVTERRWWEEDPNIEYVSTRLVCTSRQLKDYAEMGMYLGCKYIDIRPGVRKPPRQQPKSAEILDYREVTDEEKAAIAAGK